MDLSVVVPLYNEDESLPELAAWVHRVVAEQGYTYELILIDDGSNDRSWDVITELKTLYPAIVGIRFQRNYGKSAALHVGFGRARGKVVITMDADMQDSPDEIPGLYDMVMNQRYDLVSGWKKKRHDPISKTVPSKLFNYVTRVITGIRLHDFNCGLKAYSNRVIKSIEVYGEMHRYIPYLAKGAGYKRIGEKVVEHRARKYGKSKFGLERFINGFLDLLSVSFMQRFGRKPMHFFGIMGFLAFIIGSGITCVLGVRKILYATGYLGEAYKMRDLVDQPLFYIALTMAIIGVQMFLAGFLGELVVRSGADRNNYLVMEEI